MILEFEVELDEIDEHTIIYKVKRKGLQVGTLALNIEPYAIKEARITKIRGE